jgi:hypothetical protein
MHRSQEIDIDGYTDDDMDKRRAEERYDACEWEQAVVANKWGRVEYKQFRVGCNGLWVRLGDNWMQVRSVGKFEKAPELEDGESGSASEEENGTEEESGSEEGSGTGEDEESETEEEDEDGEPME